MTTLTLDCNKGTFSPYTHHQSYSLFKKKRGGGQVLKINNKKTDKHLWLLASNGFLVIATTEFVNWNQTEEKITSCVKYTILHYSEITFNLN